MFFVFTDMYKENLLYLFLYCALLLGITRYFIILKLVYKKKKHLFSQEVIKCQMHKINI